MSKNIVYRLHWVAFYTLLRREVVRITRIWTQTILPPIITMGLYFVIFGNIIGPKIGDIEGVSYIQYIVPGLVMMAIINNAYANVSSSFFGNKFQRNIEEMLVAPMPSYVILSGYVSAGIVRGIVVGILITGVSLFFTHLSIYSWIITISVAILTATLFSLAGFVNGIYAQKFDDIAFVPMFVITPLTYLGGVFYSVDLLPNAWKIVTYFNPVFYMVSGFRYGILGITDVAIGRALLILCVCVVLFYWLCLWLLQRGVGVKS